MEKVKKFALVLALVVCVMAALSVMALAADKYPNGCADCHKAGGTSKPLATVVKENYPKHPPVAATADVNACLKCHKAGGPMALNKKMHDDHAKAKVTCDACHVLGADGKPTAKVKGVK